MADEEENPEYAHGVATFPWVTWGTGGIGVLKKHKNYGTSEEGDPLIWCLIQLPEETIKKFDAKVHPEFHTIEKVYPTSMFLPRDPPDPDWIDILCGFNGELNTPALQTFAKTKLELMEKEREISQLNREIGYLKGELSSSRTEGKQHIYEEGKIMQAIGSSMRIPHDAPPEKGRQQDG